MQFTLFFSSARFKNGKLAKVNLRDVALFVVIWGSVIECAWFFNLWLDIVLFWIIPEFTVLYFFLKLHGYEEHTGSAVKSELHRTWTHEFSPVTNFFLYPIRSGLHIEHHLFPHVPWYITLRNYDENF